MDYQTKDRIYWKNVWASFINGDRCAFDLIYREFIDILFDYGLKITPNRELVKDCIQDLFISLYKYRSKLDNPEYIEYYLIKSLRRNICNQINYDRKQDQLSESEGLYFYIKYDIEEAKEEGETIDCQLLKLEQLLQGLDAKKRELLYLRFHSGLNFNEIANILGLRPNTAKKQVYRLVNELKMMCKQQVLELFFLCCKA